jgi:hypothetical protein
VSNENDVRAKGYQEQVICRMCDYRAVWKIFCLGGRNKTGDKCMMRSFMIMTLEQIFG